jgi:hypothetical protein
VLRHRKNLRVLGRQRAVGDTASPVHREGSRRWEPSRPYEALAAWPGVQPAGVSGYARLATAISGFPGAPEMRPVGRGRPSRRGMPTSAAGSRCSASARDPGRRMGSTCCSRCGAGCRSRAHRGTRPFTTRCWAGRTQARSWVAESIAGPVEHVLAGSRTGGRRIGGS